MQFLLFVTNFVVYVMDVGLRDVLLTPLKAYSAGGCVADYLNADFIAKTLTYLDFDTFSRVSHHEFFNKHYQKNTGHAPYTAALAQRSNKVRCTAQLVLRAVLFCFCLYACSFLFWIVLTCPPTPPSPLLVAPFCGHDGTDFGLGHQPGTG